MNLESEDRVLFEGVTPFAPETILPTEEECQDLQSQMVSSGEEVVKKLKLDPKTQMHRDTRNLSTPEYTRVINFSRGSYMNLRFNSDTQALQVQYVRTIGNENKGLSVDERIAIYLGDSRNGFQINLNTYDYSSAEPKTSTHQITELYPDSQTPGPRDIRISSQTPRVVQDALGTLSMYLADDM